MRMLAGLTTALGLATVFVPTASAQGPGFGMGMMGMGNVPPVMILSVPSVQTELKLDKDQVAKATTVTADYREKRQEAMSGFQDLSQEERVKKVQEVNKMMALEAKKALDGLLKPEQRKRFDQIALQQRGLTALGDPEIADALKLTDDQKSKVRQAADDNRAKSMEIFQSGDRDSMREKMTALRKENEEKLASILTADQKKAHQEMLGAPFEMPAMPRNR